MTDEEITRLCAEAMGYAPTLNTMDCNPPHYYFTVITSEDGVVCYDPLHDDAQAMALVKKFHLETYWIGAEDKRKDEWLVAPSTEHLSHVGRDVIHKELNRAICECVAKMQASKK